VTLLGKNRGGYALASPVGMTDADNIHSIGVRASIAPMTSSV
jgi:hypothetical protein